MIFYAQCNSLAYRTHNVLHRVIRCGMLRRDRKARRFVSKRTAESFQAPDILIRIRRKLHAKIFENRWDLRGEP
jgi:hypothetical protein